MLEVSVNVTRLLFALLGLLLSAVYLTAVWTVTSKGARGEEVDWQFAGQSLLVWGLLAFLVVFILGILFGHKNSGQPASEQESATSELIVMVVPTPERQSPVLQKETKLLLGAVITGMIGGLIALFLFRKRDS